MKVPTKSQNTLSDNFLPSSSWNALNPGRGKPDLDKAKLDPDESSLFSLSNTIHGSKSLCGFIRERIAGCLQTGETDIDRLE